MAAVNILNAGVDESGITYDAAAIADLDSADERANVFTEVSVTPQSKQLAYLLWQTSHS